ncbi:biogenesis of lysosome-related organelles complex 1 subunit 5-like [Lytechinus pictus]|uniref:biogenesis of lysosome-related organelles complex 1 subunit 5-like n=1 Tax=Lytechinus pictus TaxID=7653 RepID=UPI0030BA1B2F
MNPWVDLTQGASAREAGRSPGVDRAKRGRHWDIGEISARLFDHRAILQGEIKYFIKEFETKRNDRGCKRLEANLQKLKDVDETVAPDCIDIMKEHIPNLLDQLEAANKICSNLQSKEEKHMEIKTLEDQRKKREDKWSYFLEELSKERDREDIQHANEIKEIDDHFAKLEEALGTSAT